MLPCRRLAELFDQRRRQRRFRAALSAWQQAAAARRARRGQLAHSRALLARRLLGRVVAGWRRAALAGKLYSALEVVHSLQGAVERARYEVDRKTQQVGVMRPGPGSLGCGLRYHEYGWPASRASRPFLHC